MQFFSFKVYDEPKRNKFFRYGKLKKVIYKDGSAIVGGREEIYKAGKPSLYEDIDNTEKIIIESHYQKRETEPYPNFMEIRWSLHCADDKARTFLDDKEIQYKTVPLDITNEQNHNYKIIFFETISNLIDLKASNLFLTEDGSIKTIGENQYIPFMSKPVLKPKALELKGIYKLRELYQFICDEETKKNLEKSGLTGFYFEELEVIGN